MLVGRLFREEKENEDDKERKDRQEYLDRDQYQHESESVLLRTDTRFVLTRY